jgi:hypothetical protein
VDYVRHIQRLARTREPRGEVGFGSKAAVAAGSPEVCLPPDSGGMQTSLNRCLGQEATCRTPSNDETDPAWRAGALFTTSAKPEFSAYFWAGCECGFDAFAVPVGKHIVSAISRHRAAKPDFLFRCYSNPGL